MNATADATRQSMMCLDRTALVSHQLRRLNGLIDEILPHNRFYQARLSTKPDRFTEMADLEQLPFTFKDDLVGTTGKTRFAANLTWPLDQYVRMHRTSGTRGRPLIVLDTADDWQWWMDCWQYVLDACEITSVDRIMMAFSFGPFIGFWSAYDAAIRRGSLVAPAGGLGTLSRIELIRSLDATVIFCTPSYALHMAEVAAENQTNVADTSVTKIVVAGEPGGSIPEFRNQIEQAWQARVIDHAGASEVGPWGFAEPEGKGIFINEAEFIAEFFSVDSGEPAGDGELSELVLTALGRSGSPVFRYRTGDLVCPRRDHSCESCRFVLLEGGALGRVDDMLIIRGVNIFPSSVEKILRGFPEIVEYRMIAFQHGQMDALRIEIEDRLGQPDRVEKELRLRLGLKVQVECVDPGSLPRFELKGQRFKDLRAQERRK